MWAGFAYTDPEINRRINKRKLKKGKRKNNPSIFFGGTP